MKREENRLSIHWLAYNNTAQFNNGTTTTNSIIYSSCSPRFPSFCYHLFAIQSFKLSFASFRFNFVIHYYQNPYDTSQKHPLID